MASSRNDWLDLCRAVAITLVLLGHGRYLLESVFPWVEGLRFGGFLGVELFFVLSGFLIGGILLRMSETSSTNWLLNFYARRWLRTLPAYYLFLVVNILLVVLGVYKAPLDGVWKYVVFVQNLSGPHPPFFAEAWSLALEEVFYLLFPLLILLARRLLGLSPSRAIFLVAVGVIGLSLAMRIVLAESVNAWDAGVRKVVILRFDALMIGVLLAWVSVRHLLWIKMPGLVPGLLLIFFFCVLYFAFSDDASLNSSFFAKTFYFSLVPLGCAGVLLAGIEWGLPKWLRRMSGFMARISYSVYLVNLPVLLTLTYLLGCCSDSVGKALMMWLLFLVLTLMISHVVFKFYEQRFNVLRDRLFPAMASAARGDQSGQNEYQAKVR